MFVRSPKLVISIKKINSYKKEDGRTVPPFRCVFFSLRHFELTGDEPTVCELKNTCFGCDWDNTKKVW